MTEAQRLGIRDFPWFSRPPQAWSAHAAGTIARCRRLAEAISSCAVNTSPSTTPSAAAVLPADFVPRLQQALAQAAVLHLWCPEPAALAAAREAVLQTLQAQQARVCSMSRGQWLPLLQTLNRWTEGQLSGVPLPGAGQAGVWLLEDAHTLTAPQQSLLYVLLGQFSPLPLRLVLLSQTTQPPDQPAMGERMAIEWLAPEPPSWAAKAAPVAQPAPGNAPGASHGGWPWALGAAIVAALAWGLSSSPGPQQPASPELVASAASPVLGAASSASEASVAPADAASASAPPVPAEPKAPALAPQLRSWLESLPEGSHVVLHGQFATEREAQAFKARHKLLAQARIAPGVWVSGEPMRYGVLTGPFRSAERAQNHIQRLEWRAQASSFSREALLSP